jgi:chromosome segregation ATPase
MHSEHQFVYLLASIEREKRREVERQKELQGLQAELQIQVDKGSEAAIKALFNELYERFRRRENESMIQGDLLNMLEKDTQVLKKGIEILQEKKDKLEAENKILQEKLQALQEKGLERQEKLQALQEELQALQEKELERQKELQALQEKLQALQEKGPNSPLGSGPME